MRYHLGDGVELDTDTVELRVDGAAVALEPQVFNVLVYLVTNADRVVTKEELLDNVWGDRFVSESALTSRIKTVRRAVGDDGRTQKFIRTVHGRGYRWVGQVTDGRAPPVRPGPAEVGNGATEAAGPLAGTDQEPAAPVADDGWPLVGRHEQLQHLAGLFLGRETGGVLITGVAGMGKTRLAEETVRLAACEGLPVARVRGHAEARDVPLACLAHLLRSTLTDTVGPDGDLSRGLLFQSAVAALSEQAGGHRMLLLVDDIDRVDDLSQAAISSLVQSGTVFVVATQRTDDETPASLGHLTGDGMIERIELGPLSDDVLGVALYRALRSPLEPGCLAGLLAACEGSPGVLRQLVENSIHHGSLRLEDGVWTLGGELSPPAGLAALVEERLADLEDEHREAAELLAMSGGIDVDVALSLAGEEQLDALDLRGMLAVDEEPGRSVIRLAHPLYGEVLRSRIRPLRVRRLRSRLAEALQATAAINSEDRLRLARWQIESGGDVDPDYLFETARLAILEKDNDTARTLVDRLRAEAPAGRVDQLDAELHFRQGRPGEVERLLAGIDLDLVDPTVRTQIVRRRTMNLLFGLMEDERPFELLESEIAIAEGQHRTALESHRLAMRVMVGNVVDGRAQAEELLSKSDGYIRLEVLRSLAYSSWAVGDPVSALNRVDQASKLAAELGPSLSRPGLALSQLVEIFCLLQLGRLPEARAAADSYGMAVTFGWLPMAIARVGMIEARPSVVAEFLANPLGFADAVGQQPAAAWMRAGLAEVERLRADTSLAAALADRARPFVQDRGRTVDIDMLTLLAAVRAAAGDVDGAVADLLHASRRAGEVSFAIGLLEALRMASLLGAGPQARELLDRHDPPTVGPMCEAMVETVVAAAELDVAAMVTAGRAFETLGFLLPAGQNYHCAVQLAASDGGDVGAGSEAEAALSQLTSRLAEPVVLGLS